MNPPRLWLVVDGTQHVLSLSICPPFVSQCGQFFHVVRETLAPARDPEVAVCPACVRQIGYAPR